MGIYFFTIINILASLWVTHLYRLGLPNRVAFQPWGLAAGTNGWDQNDPHGLYASGTAATASVVRSGGGSNSFYVTGDLSAYDTGGYSIKNTRTGLGSLIRGAIYNSTSKRTLITCGYSIAWPTAKVAFSIGDPFQIRQNIARSRSNRLRRGQPLFDSP